MLDLLFGFDEFIMLCILAACLVAPGLLWLIHAYYDDFTAWRHKRRNRKINK